MSGVTAVKNLLEQGFDVIAYERNPHIGGLWQYNEDPNQTTVLKGGSHGIDSHDGAGGGGGVDDAC